MAKNNNRNESSAQSNERSRSIGNEQGTTQTGAQNDGGINLTGNDDEYTKDRKESSDRSSSNRKSES